MHSKLLGTGILQYLHIIACVPSPQISVPSEKAAQIYASFKFALSASIMMPAATFVNVRDVLESCCQCKLQPDLHHMMHVRCLEVTQLTLHAFSHFMGHASAGCEPWALDCSMQPFKGGAPLPADDTNLIALCPV